MPCGNAKTFFWSLSCLIHVLAQESRFGFTSGNRVSLAAFSPNVSGGELGQVVGFTDNEVRVKFAQGTWSFKPADLWMQVQGGDPSVPSKAWRISSRPPAKPRSTLKKSDPCKRHPHIKFESILHNNLGGKGPDSGREGVVFSARDMRASVAGGKPIHVIVNADTEYMPYPGSFSTFWNNSVDLPSIPIDSGSQLTVTFSLWDADTHQPYHMSEVGITFFDLDQGPDGTSAEFIVSGFSDYNTTSETELKVKDCRRNPPSIAKQRHLCTFLSTREGSGDDNPTDENHLTVQQANRAVSLVHKDVSRFQLTLGATEGRGPRFFMFSGRPSLLCAKVRPTHISAESTASRSDTERPGPCQKWPFIKFQMIVHNNLGGYGPDLGEHSLIIRSQVNGGDEVDLVITNMTEYTPYPGTMNKLSGRDKDFVSIRINSGSSVQLRCRFLAPVTLKPYLLNKAGFTFFDLDKGENGSSAEWLSGSGFASYTLWKNATEIRTKHHGNSWYIFQSTSVGSGQDNPDNAQFLTEQQMQRAVTFTYTNTSEFKLKLGASPGEGPRFFLFAGRPSILCANVLRENTGEIIEHNSTWAVQRRARDSRNAGGTARLSTTTSQIPVSIIDEMFKDRSLLQEGQVWGMACHLNCPGPAAGAVALNGTLHRGGIVGLSIAACRQACADVDECDAYIFRNSSLHRQSICYGKKDLQLSKCSAEADFVMEVKSHAAPLAKCTVLEDPHILTWDRPYGPHLKLNKFEPGDYSLVRSRMLDVQVRYGASDEFASGLATTGVAVSGELLGSGNTFVFQYVGPGRGSRGFQVFWNRREILHHLTPNPYIAQPVGEDGRSVVRLFALQTSADPQTLQRSNSTELAKSFPSFLFDFPTANLKIYALIGNGSCNLVIEAKKLDVLQDGLCGNFNCDPSDDGYSILERRGATKPISRDRSLFRYGADGGVKNGAIFAWIAGPFDWAPLSSKSTSGRLGQVMELLVSGFALLSVIGIVRFVSREHCCSCHVVLPHDLSCNPEARMGMIPLAQPSHYASNPMRQALRSLSRTRRCDSIRSLHNNDEMDESALILPDGPDGE